MRRVVDAIAAGVLISIGGCVFLACAGDGMKWLGAILFAVALLCICFKGYSLFTGKVGYLVNDHSADYWHVVGTSLLGNAISCCGVGLIIANAMPHLGATAAGICAAKLEQPFFSILVRAILCGVLMYMAVSIYKEKNHIAGIFFCVPVFILAGFEHSIANMFYFGAANMLNLQSIVYLCIVIVGNAIGGMLFPVFDRLGTKK
jgi:formate/nitrite transporter FocA (FNT family)